MILKISEGIEETQGEKEKNGLPCAPRNELVFRFQKRIKEHSTAIAPLSEKTENKMKEKEKVRENNLLYFIPLIPDK